MQMGWVHSTLKNILPRPTHGERTSETAPDDLPEIETAPDDLPEINKAQTSHNTWTD